MTKPIEKKEENTSVSYLLPRKSPKTTDHAPNIKKKKPKILSKKTVLNKTSKNNNNPLLAFLKRKNLKIPKNGTSEINSKIRELYRDEFETFTLEQKGFISKNLSLIGKITQDYLSFRGYPYIALKTGQTGVNIVEFYLHPNGDISNLKIIKTSGYTILDDNSLETIKEAYKDYPHPKETTKIRIYVVYEIIY